MAKRALLALENGALFFGDSIGADATAVGEVVFNTAITGYQEILTDPSYCRQLITLTHPHIGNVGTNDEDNESSPQVHAAGLIVRDVPARMSNWRGERPLGDFLESHGCPALLGSTPAASPGFCAIKAPSRVASQRMFLTRIRQSSRLAHLLGLQGWI